mmetsp:Transcript_26922/g.77229  ORF Transcript_26922/g.77229 Transcript_26922/m.77229 type:complete len:601 (-) Transcript_26922:97-1899(-)
MAAQQNSQTFVASDVLGDTLPSPRTSGKALGGKDVGFLRQRVIVHLLEQVPMDPATLYATCTRLMQAGVLTDEAVPELRSLALDTDAGGGKVVRQLEARLPGDQLLGHGRSMQGFLDLPSRFEQDFERLEILGRGAFGEVWRCRHRLDGREYAVKAVQYRTSAGDAGEVERRVLREASTWAGVSHPNIVRYHSAWVEVQSRTMPKNSPELLSFPPTSTTRASKAVSLDSYEVSEEDSDSESDDGGVIFSPSASLGTTGLSSPCEFSDTPDPEAAPTPAAMDTEGFGVVARGETSAATAQSSTRFQSPAVMGRHLPSYQATLYIQAELCGKDTLMSWIAQRNAAMSSKLYTQEDHRRWAGRAADIFHQCAVALEHLHAKNCAHRDVKPSNVLFGRDGNVRLGDFGLAKVLEGPRSLADDHLNCADKGASPARPGAAQQTRAAGTPSYASPEQLAAGACGVETDVYALGMILAELLCPVRTQMERAALLEGLRRDRKVPSEASAAFPAAASLAVDMTHPDPLQRPTILDLLKAYPDVVREVQQRLGSDALLDVKTQNVAMPEAGAKGWKLPQDGRDEEKSPSLRPSPAAVTPPDVSPLAPCC